MWKFLESEMKVIFGLTEDANRTDSEIADAYGFKKGTVSSIKRRLLESGAIRYTNVPAFNKLGCEMLGFHAGAADPSERANARMNDYIEFCGQSPQVFEGIMGGGSVALFTAFRDVSDYELFMQNHGQFFTGHRRPSKARLRGTQFPFTLSRGTYVPNFAPIVHSLFQLEVPAPKERLPVACSVESPDLNTTERKAIVAMVEHPMASDREIASETKFSRQAITRIRNRLLDEGFITRVCIPRLYRWGFEICVIAHAQFNMELPWDKRLISQPRKVVSSSFFTLSKPDEGVASFLIPRFSEYSEALESVMVWYHKANAFDEKPDLTLFPLERSVELRTFEYGPAVRNLVLGSSG